MRILIYLFPLCALAAGPSGSWQCRTSEGPTTLHFLNARQLHYNGELMLYQERDQILWVEQQGQPLPYPYKLSKQQLTIHTPEGEQIICQRSQASPPSSPQTGGGANHFLRGLMCSWSGSSGGGSSYSSSHRIRFDGQGRFAYGSEASFSGGAGQYAGQGGGQSGRYQVSAARIGAAVTLQWDNGRRDTLYVHFMAGGRITELKSGQLLFAAQLCN